MSLYTVIEAIVGIIAGLLLAICTKKNENVSYGRLDKVGKITNILLIPVYVCVSPFCMLLGMLSSADHDGFLGLLGWVVSIIIASSSMFSGLGLGASVALRKKGRSKLSFAAQFAGVAGIVLTVVLFFVFYDNLLSSLN